MPKNSHIGSCEGDASADGEKQVMLRERLTARETLAHRNSARKRAAETLKIAACSIFRRVKRLRFRRDRV
jgi:transcriptional regulator with PAS, ATPase and Fis domain